MSGSAQTELHIDAKLFFPDAALPPMTSDLQPLSESIVVPFAPVEIATLIGYIILGAAMFEDNMILLTKAFCKELNEDERWFKMGFKSKRKAFSDYSKRVFAHNSRVAQSLVDLSNDIVQSFKVRDLIAHGHWGYAPNPGRELLLLSRDESHVMSVSDLIHANQQISRCNAIMISLVRSETYDCRLASEDIRELTKVLSRILQS